VPVPRCAYGPSAGRNQASIAISRWREIPCGDRPAFPPGVMWLNLVSMAHPAWIGEAVAYSCLVGRWRDNYSPPEVGSSDVAAAMLRWGASRERHAGAPHPLSFARGVGGPVGRRPVELCSASPALVSSPTSTSRQKWGGGEGIDPARNGFTG
jgi:hypothetical protein